jgi:rubrerythrin
MSLAKMEQRHATEFRLMRLELTDREKGGACG